MLSRPWCDIQGQWDFEAFYAKAALAMDQQVTMEGSLGTI